MTKLYQILNDQFQPVKVFTDLYAAKQHIFALQEGYADEMFYIVELQAIYSGKPAHAQS